MVDLPQNIHLSVSDHPEIVRHIRVFLDEADISNLCYEFDTLTGRAECYRLNENGRKYLDDDTVAVETRYGKITYEVMDDISLELRRLIVERLKEYVIT